MFNNVAARHVALQITINGLTVGGAISFELFQSAAFCADRFILSMAFSAATGASYYAGLSAALISVKVTFDSSAGLTLIEGQIDNVTIDFDAKTARLSGRDLSARLIDAEVNQSFANQTSSEIANKFALIAGLTPNIEQTKTPIGQYYELAYTRTALGMHTRNATQWQLLATLAEIEAYSLSVTGTTLNFLPLSSQDALVTLIYGQDLINLIIDKAVNLIDAKITVKSWNIRLKTAHQTMQGAGISTTLAKPNLMPDQVNSIAVAKQAELVAQTTLLRTTMPGETRLLPQTLINLQGTNTTMDGLYIIQNIERYIDAHHGFTQIVEAYAST